MPARKKTVKSDQPVSSSSHLQRMTGQLSVLIKGLAILSAGTASYLTLRWVMSSDTESERIVDENNQLLNQISSAVTPYLEQGFLAAINFAIPLGAISYHYLDRQKQMGALLTGLTTLPLSVEATQETASLYFSTYNGFTGVFTVQDGNGGSIVGGNGANNLPQILFLDNTGKINAIKTINISPPPSSQLTLKSGCQTADGGMLVVLDQTDPSYTYVKLDPSLNILWAKTISSSSFALSSAYCAPDNSVIFLGSSFTGIDCPFLVKINDLGILKWSKNYCYSTHLDPSSANLGGDSGPKLLAFSPNNDIVFTATSTNVGAELLFTMKVDQYGNLIWANSWGLPPVPANSLTQCNSITFTQDGGVLLGISTDAFVQGDRSNSQGGILKFDATGKNLLFGMIYPTQSGGYSAPICLEQLDGSIVAILEGGWHQSPTSSAVFYNLLSLFSSEGNYLSSKELICPSIFYGITPTDAYIDSNNGCIVFSGLSRLPNSNLPGQLAQIKLSPSGDISECSYSQKYPNLILESIIQNPVPTTSQIANKSLDISSSMTDTTSSVSVTSSSAVPTEQLFCSANIIINTSSPTAKPKKTTSTPNNQTNAIIGGVAVGAVSAFVGFGAWLRYHNKKKDAHASGSSAVQAAGSASREMNTL